MRRGNTTTPRTLQWTLHAVIRHVRTSGKIRERAPRAAVKSKIQRSHHGHGRTSPLVKFPRAHRERNSQAGMSLCCRSLSQCSGRFFSCLERFDVHSNSMWSDEDLVWQLVRVLLLPCTAKIPSIFLGRMRTDKCFLWILGHRKGCHITSCVHRSFR